MELSEDQILQKYAKQCPSCNKNGLLPYQYEWSCQFCIYNIIKQNHELTLTQRKRLTFSLRLKYAGKKINCICFDVIQLYNGENYDKMLDVLSKLRNNKLKIKKQLIDIYKNMPPEFQQTEFLKSAKRIYKISYDCNRFMIYLCRYNITNSINYFDLIGTITFAKQNFQFNKLLSNKWSRKMK